MEDQEIMQELNHPGARELLRSAPLARLAYTGPDDLPRVIPIGFHWNGAQLVVCTAPTSPKAQSLSARPHVALTIDTGDVPAEAKSLLLRGDVTVEIVDGVPDEFIAASTKSMVPAQLGEFEVQVRAVYKQMMRIVIEPRWARYYDFGAGRVPTFLQRLGREESRQ